MTPCYYCEAYEGMCKECIHSNTYVDPSETISKLQAERDNLLVAQESSLRTIVKLTTKRDEAKMVAATGAKYVEENERLKSAIQTLMTMNVKGYELQDRLQFSSEGREILAKVKSALGEE